MKLAQGEAIAEYIIQDFQPYAQRIAIAGSVRRKKAEVKDVEIIVIPAYETQVVDLFGGTERRNLLFGHVGRESAYTQIKPGVPGIEPWHIQPNGLYWRLLFEGVKVDVFLCTEKSWALNLMIRTGSGIGLDGLPQTGFGPAMLSRWKTITGGGKSQAAQLHRANGDVVAAKEEPDVFEACRVIWVPPEERIDYRAVIAGGIAWEQEHRR
jgi:DNA polymerase/3'-5' exonuclease PolX